MSRWSRKPKKSEIDPPGRATVHRDAHARNERGARRYQEAHEIGDVLGARDAFQRIRAHRLGAMGLDGLPGRRGLLGDEALPARGRRRGGRYGRDENVRGRTEVGETLREVYEPRVGDPARQIAGRGIARGGTDNIDDPSPALGLHDREHGPSHPNVTEDLQAPVAGPLLVGNFQEVAAPYGARVVHEDVEPAEAIPHRRGDAIHFVEPAQVAGDDENLRFRLRLDLLRGLLEPRLVARADRDPGALGAQAERDGPPDPLASARHQRRLAGQFEIHEVSFLTLSAAGSRSGEGRDRSPVEAEKLVQRARHRLPERLQIDPVELPSGESAAPLFEQRSRSGEVSVGQVLVAHRHLDEPLQRLAIAPLRVAPRGLEKLVDLEIEMRVEKGRRGVEDVRARADSRADRSRGERGAGAHRALPQKAPVRELVVLEPGRGRGARRTERRQLATRLGVVQRGEDDLGQTVPDPEGGRRDHATPEAVDSTSVSAGGPGGGSAADAGPQRSPRLPATCPWREQLSPRGPAMTKPSMTGAAEAKYATWRRSAVPNGGGPASSTTTRTPTIIFPIVWPPRAWSTVV